MKGGLLEKIMQRRRHVVDEQKRSTDTAALYDSAVRTRAAAAEHRLSAALSDGDRFNIIAEIKRASPSKGVLNSSINVRDVAQSYESGGARAISVLTEPEFFNGSLEDLKAARDAVSLPLLQKDFIFDEFQIYEAAAAGADAILLIVAAIEEKLLAVLHGIAHGLLRMDVLVEVHDEDELEIAKTIGAQVIGVNNRDLRSLEVSLDTSRRLSKLKPPGSIMIAESGISTLDEIAELRSLGFDGFLIGESLMRSGDPRTTLDSWTRGAVGNLEYDRS